MAKKKIEWRSIAMVWYPYIVLALVVILFGIVTKGTLFSSRNIRLIAEQSFELMLGCLAALFIFAQGELDFAMAAEIGVSAILAAYVSQTSILLALIVALCVGGLIGIVNGFIRAKFGIPVFFLTFCVANVIGGFLSRLADYRTVPAPFGIIKFDDIRIKIAVLAVYLIVMYLLYEKTRIGKVSKAMGVNETVAIQSGIKMRFYRSIPFVFTGVTAGLIGFFMLCKTGGASSMTGQLFHFDVLVAMALGGAAMGGPKVKFRCAIVGALIITILTSGMNLAGVPVAVQNLLKGCFFLIVIVATNKLSALATE